MVTPYHQNALSLSIDNIILNAMHAYRAGIACLIGRFIYKRHAYYNMLTKQLVPEARVSYCFNPYPGHTSYFAYSYVVSKAELMP